MRTLVTGSTGLLGGVLLPCLKAALGEVVGHGLEPPGEVAADLCDRAAAHRLLEDLRPDAIVNLVCLSNVDRCEEDPNLAYRLNVRALENLAAWMEHRSGTRLVQISTDHVYDGPGLHREEDVTIRNTYALTKYAAELAALRAGGACLRTNFFGRSRTKGRASLSDWLIDSLRAGKPVTLFTDVLFSPLSMRRLSEMVVLALRKSLRGVYNVGSREGMSKRDFAHALARRVSLPLANARDGTQKALNLRAVRPAGMLMDVSRFEQAAGVRLPSLQEEIETAEVE
jgi:dTDP-4-dehydrorhamnose reductase